MESAVSKRRPIRRRRELSTRPPSGIRQTIDSLGGLLVIGSVTGAIVILAVAASVLARPTALTSRDASDRPLVGNMVEAHDDKTDRLHTTDASEVEQHGGGPPARGPHFGSPQRVGVYQESLPDGNVIHSLEHGIVWIS